MLAKKQVLSNCRKYITAIQAKNEENSWNLEQKYQMTEGSSSIEEHMENALALGADEGRDKLR